MAVCQKERAGYRKKPPYESGPEKRFNSIGVRLRAWYGLEIDTKVAKQVVHLVGERQSDAWPININAFNQVPYSMVEHVENGQGRLLGGILERRELG